MKAYLAAVLVVCFLGAVSCTYRPGQWKPPSSTGPYNPNPPPPRWRREASPLVDLEDRAYYEEPSLLDRESVYGARFRRFSVPIVVVPLPAPPPPPPMA